MYLDQKVTESAEALLPLLRFSLAKAQKSQGNRDDSSKPNVCSNPGIPRTEVSHDDQTDEIFGTDAHLAAKA